MHARTHARTQKQTRHVTKYHDIRRSDIFFVMALYTIRNTVLALKAMLAELELPCYYTVATVVGDTVGDAVIIQTNIVW